MTVIGFTCAKGSPGVTTTALALAWAWPRVHPGHRVLVIDADPAGAGTTFGFLRGQVPGRCGVLDWAAGLRAPARAGGHGPGLDARRWLWEHLVAFDQDATRLLLPGAGDAAQAQAVAQGWDVLAQVVRGITKAGEAEGSGDPVDVLIDLGRAGTVGERQDLWRACGVLVVVTRSSLAQAAAAAALVDHLHRQFPDGPAVRVVLVGQGAPYRASEIAMAVHVPVAGVLAMDRASAAVFSDGAPTRRGLETSPLLRSAHTLASALSTDERSRTPASARARANPGEAHPGADTAPSVPGASVKDAPGAGRSPWLASVEPPGRNGTGGSHA